MNRVAALLLAVVGLLVVPSVPVSAAPAASGANAWASVTAPDQVLKKGCRDYRFSYRVDAPGDEWMLELFLVGPRGARIATDTFESAAQKTSERRTWRICRSNTRAGVHRIDIKVTSYDGREVSEQRVESVTFTLSKPAKPARGKRR